MDTTNKRDLERFRNAIAGMAVTFRQEASEVLFSGYWMGLEDLSIETVERSVMAAIRQCRFMPTVAELREMTGEIRPEQRAALAWSVALRALSQHGPYRAVDFDDPALNATIRAFGGWPDFDALLGMMPAHEAEGIFRRRFEQTYTAILARGMSAEAARPLSGLSEIPRPPERVRCDLPALPMEKIRKLPRTPQATYLRRMSVQHCTRQ